jgi:hypothetical protein
MEGRKCFAPATMSASELGDKRVSSHFFLLSSIAELPPKRNDKGTDGKIEAVRDCK